MTNFKLSEDWLATIIGLVIVLVIGAGLLGPGPQNVSLKAEAGESASGATVPAISGWKISGTLNGEKAAIENAPTALESTSVYLFQCDGDTLSLVGTLPLGTETVETAPAGKARLEFDNQCSAAASLTFTTDAAIRWPIFNLLAR